MNLKTIILLLGVILSFFSCSDDDPLTEGVGITLRNTLQDPNESENTYASLFGKADNAFDESGILSNNESEFSTALAQPSTVTGLPFDINGIYDIDFTEISISFRLTQPADDPFWSGVYGVFPAGKFDRYYFTFNGPHNIKGFTSSNSSVRLRIDSDTLVVVEISEGYDMNPGISFTIDLE